MSNDGMGRRLSGLATLLAAAIAAAGAWPVASQGRLRILDVEPPRHALTAPVDSVVRVRLDRPVDAESLTPTSFWVFGRWSGGAAGRVTLGDGGRTLTLIPDRHFSAGETVTVFVSRELRGRDGSRLRDGGYSFQFWTRSRGAGFDFREIARLSTRSGRSTRAYGGFGSDLDGDGFLDLTIVNEDTNDLRTFLNRGDRSGRVRPFLRPPARTGNVPSPSEPADFDRDGHVDVVVANTRDDTVSVLLGRGDGTFARATHYPVGGEARGVAVLDADGDGDTDIAATSFVDSRVTLLLNDGAGGFDEARRFATADGARAIAAADMDDDGILDLVVGALAAQEIAVYLGNGDGSFSLSSTASAGGEVWMLVLGDVDGNGTEDVAAVNSTADAAALLMGDGRGGLAAARPLATDPFPLATDLADLDGDGDLDWVTSSFFGNWLVFANDGAGNFSLDHSWSAPQAASCSVPMDLDNDGVLDLVLIDELEDRLVLLRNRALLFADDFESGSLAAWSRSRGAVRAVSPGLAGSAGALEVTVDGSAARAWVESREPRAETSLVVELELRAGGVRPGERGLEILRLGAGRGQARLVLRRDGGRTRVHLEARERGGFREVGSARLPGRRVARLRVEWSSARGRALTDGRAALVVSGQLRALAEDLDNSGSVVQRVRLGLPSGSAGAAGGVLLVDGYVSTR